ncbi:hypothetical protein [Sporolactobacillus laevolacticus]|uniref:family 4 glycosyl hydrolase n=1 Tax=Sporolactobacillus laevolacticus TaxID=33018 RepID=UPI0025B2D8C2|nr:hypothetical protein [Sporolactobacillus laevolacticus]MDN3956460.1 hypothetical protein [Sporolactobacillus laevolacticus]
MVSSSNSLKFVFIGAGSSFFTMRLVGDILGEESIEGGQLVLVDLNDSLLEETKNAVTKLVRFAKGNFEISAQKNYRDALGGADFVFLTYATGGYERWKKDIEICTKHGVLQSVGDTIGPGGIIRTLRTIPVVLDIATEMEKRCPDAWIINYSNPEGAICLAIQKYTKIKSFGLCHGTPDTASWIAKEVFHVDSEKLEYRAAGINHLTWFTDLTIDGTNVYPQLLEKLIQSGMDKEEPISTQLFRTYGLYPAPGDRHVGEFFPFFLKERVLNDQDYEWKNNDFTVVDGWRSNLRQLFDEIRLKDSGYEKLLEGSGETATHFIRSLVTGETATEMVNTINKGYIENISDGVIVELPTFIDRFGLHPQKIGRLPDGIAYKCDTLGREYLLAVEAAVTNDYSKALQAMYLDPLVSNCDYPELLLLDLIKENRDVLPQAWSSCTSDLESLGGRAHL